MSEVAHSADVVIVGGGLVGCSTAYYLAKAGVDVLLLDRQPINREASGTNAGSLHLQIYIHPHFPDDWIERIRPTIHIMREAAQGWATIESDLNADCGVRLGGGLWVAENREEMQLIESKVVAEREMGVLSETKTRDELLAIAPYLGKAVIGGSFLKGEGYANPLLVAPAFIKAATALGARVQQGAEVTAIEKRPGGFELTTSVGKVKAEHVVSAAGAWTGPVGRLVGLNLPVEGSTAQVIVTEGRPNIMLDHLLQHVGKGLTLKQSPQGTFIIGGGWPAHLDKRLGRKVPMLNSLIGNAWVAARTVPEIANAQLVRSWSGMGGGSIDGLPILGASSRVPGFHVAYAPLGFTMGPTCGRLFAELFVTGHASIPLEPFSPDRFLGA